MVSCVLSCVLTDVSAHMSVSAFAQSSSQLTCHLSCVLSCVLSCQCSRRSAAQTPPDSCRGRAETPCACAATWRAGTCRNGLSQKPLSECRRKGEHCSLDEVFVALNRLAARQLPPLPKPSRQPCQCGSERSRSSNSSRRAAAAAAAGSSRGTRARRRSTGPPPRASPARSQSPPAAPSPVHITTTHSTSFSPPGLSYILMGCHD